MVDCEVVDGSGAPMAGVAVSDGEAVVNTDERGEATLPDGGRPFVWVSRPDGYDTDRWFARVDDPDAAHDGVIRFELARIDQPLPVTFAHVTDLHVSALPEPASMPQPDSIVGLDESGNLALKPLTTATQLVDVLDELAATDGAHGPPRFFVATGDLTDHGTDEDYTLLAEALAASPLAVLTLPGNHDHHGLEEQPRPDATASVDRGISAETLAHYEAHLGPRWWSLTHAGLRLVALDWFSHLLGIDDDVQERWLAADLASAPAGAPVLFLTHDQMSAAFYDRVAAAAPHVRIVGSLSGHWHTSRVVRHDGQLHANAGNATYLLHIAMLAVFAALGLGMALPFLLLLWRDLKRNPRKVRWVALIILIMRVIDLVWNVGPVFRSEGSTLHWLDFVVVLAIVVASLRTWADQQPLGGFSGASAVRLQFRPGPGEVFCISRLESGPQTGQTKLPTYG